MLIAGHLQNDFLAHFFILADSYKVLHPFDCLTIYARNYIPAAYAQAFGLAVSFYCRHEHTVCS